MEEEGIAHILRNDNAADNQEDDAILVLPDNHAEKWSRHNKDQQFPDEPKRTVGHTADDTDQCIPRCNGNVFGNRKMKSVCLYQIIDVEEDIVQ